MKRINVDDVLKQAQQKEALPELKIIIKRNPGLKKEPLHLSVDHGTQNFTEIKIIGVTRQQISSGSNPKVPVVDECWADYHKEKLQRKKLSTQIAAMVAAAAGKDDLMAHYEKIEAHSATMRQLYDRARFAEANGKLPDANEDNNAELLALEKKRSRLVDKRCKLQSKIKKGTAKNPDRITNWHLGLDRANAEYDQVDNEIKKITGKV
jgi:hypothetical protein